MGNAIFKDNTKSKCKCYKCSEKFPFENNTNLMVYIVIYIILKKQNEE